MALQQVFKTSYITELQTNINVADYLQDSFPWDESRCTKLYGINHPEGLLEKLDPTPEGDLKSAISIYEAYKDLSPLLAQQDNLWVYLTHVDLFEYVKKRWPIVVGDGNGMEKVKSFIIDHWFRNRNSAIRSALSGLWWSVYLSIDLSRDNIYELTEVLFRNYSLRTVYFGKSILFRHKEATIGILSFIKDNPELFNEHFEVKIQTISKHFNGLGAVKQLTYLKAKDFYNECDKIRVKIASTEKRSDVQNVEFSISQ